VDPRLCGDDKKVEKSFLSMKCPSLRSIFLVACLFLFVCSPSSQAAHLYFGVHRAQVGVGQEFPVGFFVDTEQEMVNAIEGTVVYDQRILALQEVRDANSIINFWIERPTADAACTADCRVRFGGIVPGGFSGARGLVLTFVFTARAPGVSVVAIEGSRILEHDGKGTELPVRIGPIEITVADDTPIVPSGIPEDREPPDAFVPVVTRDQNIFDGKWFVVFATQDKGSGIARYEMTETPRAITGDEEHVVWRSVQSPALLEDQTLGSHITVRAIDGTGNSRSASLLPANPPRLSSQLFAWGIVIVLLFVVLFVGRLLWRNIRQRHARR
jgi:hypothetical protein